MCKSMDGAQMHGRSHSVDPMCWHPCSCVSMEFMLRTKLHNYTVAKETHLAFATEDQRLARRMEHKKLIMPCLALETLPVTKITADGQPMPFRGPSAYET